jgi:4-alpha-glucanotransferase
VSAGLFASDGVLERREAGVLLHPTALPGGRIGEAALGFIEFLAAAGCRVWQVLPLGPTGPDLSPYSPSSVFAGNAALLPAGAGSPPPRSALADFVEQERAWLTDYALFVAAKRAGLDAPWWEWPEELRDRDPQALRELAQRHATVVESVYVEQFRFAARWRELRAAAHARGIRLYGDMPMFTVADSADVWAHRHLFQLDRDGRAAAVAGVPPDAFSADGQLWGNPLFDWEAMRAEGFRWWIERVRHELERCDLLRLDHFRGLVATWAVPAGAASAREGEWREVPGRELLQSLKDALGRLPLVAENLGVITPDVEALRHAFGLPGMHVLQFAFDGTEENPHRPERHEEQGVAYTGTHDNDTTLGWFRSLDAETRREVLALTGGTEEDMPWPAIETVLGSRARLAVVPMQDFLGLGSEARMNRPGVAAGNWRWQLGPQDLTPALAGRIAAAVSVARR